MRSLKHTAALGGLLAVAATGCIFGNIPNLDESDLESVDRNPDQAFDSIKNDSELPVYVSEGSEMLKVTCDDEIVHEIVTTTFDHTLRINLPRVFEPSGGCRVDVRTPSLVGLDNSMAGQIIADDHLDGLFEIRNRGEGIVDIQSLTTNEINAKNEEYGTIIFRDLDANLVELENEGDGNITANGECDTLRVANRADGTIDADGLRAKHAHVINEDSGHVSVQVTGDLSQSNTGNGDIDVVGSPSTVTDDAPSSGGY